MWHKQKFRGRLPTIFIDNHRKILLGEINCRIQDKIDRAFVHVHSWITKELVILAHGMMKYYIHPEDPKNSHLDQ